MPRILFCGLIGLVAWFSALPAAGQEVAAATAQGPVESLSALRGRVVLNGLWRFMPATGPAAEAPDNDWGLIAVPGTWQRSGWQHGMAALPEFPVKGSGPQWKDLGRTLGRGWYEREIEVPSDWAGRSVLLDFRRVSTEATVFVNGKKCGEVPWPYGEVDITSAVQPGEKATLRVLVVATPDPGESIVWMGTTPGQNFTVKSELSRSGLIGEVFLLSRPGEAHVSDVFVQPSVRRKQLVLDVELSGVRAAGELALTAELRNSEGVVEKTFESKVAAQAAAVQRVQAVFAWEDPKLWDLGEPHLYDLHLAVKGGGIDDVHPVRFGFREFWIEGRDFFLNGTPIRLRPALPDEPFALAEIDGVIDGMRSRGFNASQMWPTDHDKRGNAFQHREVFAERADEKGWLVIGSLLSMSPYLVDTKYHFIWNADRRETWRQRMERDMRRFRNHPSIIMWGSTANFFNLSSDQDPRHIGRRNFLASDATDVKVAAGREGLDLIRKADPTRPVFTHAGNRMGDVYTLNHYLNMLPVQEREEHLSEYAKSGEMPAMSVEFGNLLSCDVFRGRNPFQENIRTEPWMTEFAASYLGARAYREESEGYRRELRTKYEGGQVWSNWQNNPQLLNAPTFMELNALMIRNTWRAWRTWGYPGGMLPWDMAAHLFSLRQAKSTPAPAFQPGQRAAAPAEFRNSMLHYLRPEGGYTPNVSGQALFAVNGPTLAYIAGPFSDFADKQHAFRAGDRVAKSAVVINDERTPREYRFEWSANVGGKQIAGGKFEGTVGPAQTLRLPMEFELAGNQTERKVPGTLRLSGSIGDVAHGDVFYFRVFGVESGGLKFPTQVFLWDPAGKTSDLLKTLGVPCVAVADKLPSPKDGLLIIGRGAFSGGQRIPGAKGVEDLAAFTASGGRLLVMAQSPDWYRDQIGLRVSRVVSRRVFAVNDAHPVVAGLDEMDLRDWAGAGTLIEPFPKYDAFKYPTYGWRWGNRGSVTSAALEKPHHGAWRPILECDFDLAYSPLMEMDFGAGRVTLCTLDLEDRTDPAAALLGRQMIANAATAPLAPRAPATVLLGGDEDEAFFKSLGLKFERTTALPAKPALAVLGASAGVNRTQLQAFLQRGGRALVLGTPTVPENGAATAAGAVLVGAKKFGGAKSVPDWPEAGGLSLSDLRNRGDYDTVLLADAQTGIETGAEGVLGRLVQGAGVAVFSQLMPEQLDVKNRQWLRFTRWRQIRATAQLLANLGAEFESDARIFHPQLRRIGLAGEWQYVITESKPAASSPDERHAFAPTGEATRNATGAVPADARTIVMPAAVPEFDQQDGEAVIYKRIQLPASWVGKVAALELGIVDDFDEVFVNGKSVGKTTDEKKETWSFKRRYRIPLGLLREGENLIAVRVLDVFGGGGFNSGSDDLALRLISSEKSPAFYDGDYREDFELGDEPYRYYRW